MHLKFVCFLPSLPNFQLQSSSWFYTVQSVIILRVWKNGFSSNNSQRKGAVPKKGWGSSLFLSKTLLSWMVEVLLLASFLGQQSSFFSELTPGSSSRNGSETTVQMHTQQIYSFPNACHNNSDFYFLLEIRRKRS